MEERDGLERLPEMDEELGEKMNLQNAGMSHEDIAEAHEKLLGEPAARDANLHTDGMVQWGKMNVWDQETFRKAMELPFVGKSMRWIASIPVGVAGMMWEANPDMFSDPKELKKWLRDTSPKGGAKYRVPGSKL